MFPPKGSTPSPLSPTDTLHWSFPPSLSASSSQRKNESSHSTVFFSSCQLALLPKIRTLHFFFLKNIVWRLCWGKKSPLKLKGKLLQLTLFSVPKTMMGLLLLNNVAIKTMEFHNQLSRKTQNMNKLMLKRYIALQRIYLSAMHSKSLCL